MYENNRQHSVVSLNGTVDGACVRDPRTHLVHHHHRDSLRKQCFKLSRLAFWPFGTVVNKNFGKHPIANVIWIIFGGLELCIGFGLAGIIWCITIIGIPFGKQCFKLAGLSITPFGATFGEKEAAAQ